MRKQNINIFICTLLCLLSFAACSTEDFFSPAGQEGNVLLVLPGVSTRVSGDDFSDNEEDGISLVYDNEESEGGIDTSLGLWFYAFPKDDKGTLYIKNLTDADLGTPDNKGHRLFNLSLTAGEYDFCIAANIPGLAKVYSAEDLKEKILQYPKESDLNNLKPGHLPMYRSLKITIEENENQTVDMHMMFLCSKVLVKMKMAAGSTTTQKLTGLSLSHVATQSQVDKDLCKQLNVEGFLGDQSAVPCDFTKEENGVEITTEENDYYTFYLPEYYNDGMNGPRTPTVLHFDIADASGTNTKKYDLPLGGAAFPLDDEALGNKNLSEVTGGNLERGTQYDITAILHDQGEEWTLTVENFVWNTETMDAGFMQTTLWVSDTKKDTHILPFVGAEFDYMSNAKVDIECPKDEWIYGKPIFKAIYEDKANDKNGVVVMLNPDLSMAEMAKWAESENANLKKGTDETGREYYEGTAHVTIKANNLTKTIEFQFKKYDMFEVEPMHVTLRSDDQTGTYICRTNLGEVTVGSYNKSVNCDPPQLEKLSDGSYKITVKATSFGEKQETSFPLYVNGKEKATLTLTIIPKGKHVVHFTAINSYLREQSSSTLGFCAGWNLDYLPEWNYDYSSKKEDANFKYPQTLISEDAYKAMSDDEKKKVHYWVNPRIIYGDNNTEITGTTNGIWTNFSIDDTPTAFNFIGTDKNPPYGKNETVNYALWRHFNATDDVRVQVNDTPLLYPYINNDLRMFHFESREGWIVADPTVLKDQWLDFEPEIVNVKYVVDVTNCDAEALGMRWYLNYGQTCQGSTYVGRFLIQSEPDTDENFKAGTTDNYMWDTSVSDNKAPTKYESVKAYKVADKHYRFIFTLQSVAHNTAKDIYISVRTTKGTIECGRMFNGQDFAVSHDVKNGGLVACGTYNASSDTWTKTPENADKTGEQIKHTKIPGTADGKLESLNPNNGKFRIYFYMPMEPYSWQATKNVYLHLQGKGNGDDKWYGGDEKRGDDKSKVTLKRYITEKGLQPSEAPSLSRWWYIDIEDVQEFTRDGGPYKEAQVYDGELIAVFFNDFKNSKDDISDDPNMSGFIYKSDCWAWGTADNSYYPDFKVKYNNKGTQYLGPGKVIYYMDRKAFLTRPR